MALFVFFVGKFLIVLLVMFFEVEGKFWYEDFVCKFIFEFLYESVIIWYLFIMMSGLFCFLEIVLKYVDIIMVMSNLGILDFVVWY